MRFEGFETHRIEYKLSEENIESDIQFYIKESPDYEKNNCGLILGIKLTDSDRSDGKALHLNVGIKGRFVLVEEELTEKNLKELIIPNGTAILFPYLRTLVSTITGYDTLGEGILLPTVNIPKLLESEKLK